MNTSRALRGALISLGVCVAVYPDVFFGGRTLLPVGRSHAAYAERPDQRSPHARAELDPTALASQVMPWAYVERRALIEHELPLWDRFSGLGHPLLGNGQTALFYPLHWLVLIDPSSPALWDAAFLIMRFFAALGSVFLLLELGAPAPLAALGAPIGALNGVFMLLATRADLQGYACMPWVLLALFRMRRSPGPAPALGLAVAAAICLFGAHPEPSFAALSACALVGLLLLIREEPRRGAFILWTSVGAAGALLLSAPLWLPLLDLIPQSWSLHPEGIAQARRPAVFALQWLMPTALEKGNLRSLFGNEIPIGYLGPACSVLAACAIAGAAGRDRRALAWIWAAVFLALAIYGAPGTGWLAKVPLLGRMTLGFYYQFPALYLLAIGGVIALPRLGPRAIVAATLAIVLVAASAPAWAHVESPLLKLGYAAVAATAFGSLALFARGRPWMSALLVLACTADLAAFRSPLSRRADPLASGPYIAWLHDRARTEAPFRVMGLGSALAPDSAAAFALEDVRLCDALVPRRMAEALDALVQRRPPWHWETSGDPEDGFDAASPLLDWANVRYFVTQGTPPFRIESPLMRAFLDARPRLADARMDAEAAPGLVLWKWRPATARVRVPPERPVLAGRVVHLRTGEIPSWQVAVDGAAAASGPEGPLRADLSHYAGREVPLGLRASEYAFFVDLHWESARGDRDPVEDVLHGLRVAVRDTLVPELLVLERPHPWPRAVAAATPEASADPLGQLSSRRTEQGPFAIVEDDFPRAVWAAACASGACNAQLRVTVSAPSYTTNGATLLVEANRPAIVVVADAWAEGWHALIDGQAAPLFHANYAFRGVVAPAGRHRIELRYSPRVWSFAWPLALAGIALAVFLAALAASNGRRGAR